MSLRDKFNKFFNENPETKNLEVVEKVKEEVQKFEEVSLVDGTMINVEPALEVGAVVTVMSEDVAVPMPAGEYELADNRLMVIDEAGVIVDLMEKVAEEEAVVEEELKTESTIEQEQKAKKIIESIVKEHVFELDEKLKEKEKEIKFLKEENETIIKMFTEFKAFNKEMFEGLMDEPSKEPIKEKVSMFGKKEKKNNIFLK
jgi:hypothetical protein